VGLGCSRGTRGSPSSSARAGSKIVESAVLRMEFVVARAGRCSPTRARDDTEQTTTHPRNDAGELRARRRPPHVFPVNLRASFDTSI
jgi:hypothetical protein